MTEFVYGVMTPDASGVMTLVRSTRTRHGLYSKPGNARNAAAQLRPRHPQVIPVRMPVTGNWEAI